MFFSYVPKNRRQLSNSSNLGHEKVVFSKKIKNCFNFQECIAIFKHWNKLIYIFVVYKNHQNSLDQGSFYGFH